MSPLAKFVTDQAIPASLTTGFFLVQRFGIVTLLPLNLVIEREYGNYSLLLGVAAALVASGTFTQVTHQFGIGTFLVTALAGVVTVSPFIFARYGISLGLAPAHFAMVATFAYLGLAVVIGLLFGGCWSVILKTFRERRLP